MIYYVMAISIRKKTEEDLKKEYEKFKITFNKNVSFEKFMEHLKQLGSDKIAIGSFISSFHLVINSAKKYAEENICDINEAGCYEYAAIVAVDTDTSYYNIYIKEEDCLLYKYNHEIDKYEAITKEDELYNHLIKYIRGF